MVKNVILNLLFLHLCNHIISQPPPHLGWVQIPPSPRQPPQILTQSNNNQVNSATSTFFDSVNTLSEEAASSTLLPAVSTITESTNLESTIPTTTDLQVPTFNPIVDEDCSVFQIICKTFQNGCAGATTSCKNSSNSLGSCLCGSNDVITGPNTGFPQKLADAPENMLLPGTNSGALYIKIFKDLQINILFIILNTVFSI
ncbi:hypothetical protein HK099_003255 [Clydaea vesicula]|uniref:Uncharacterized protein n=1 Tax=Clydaea vesicula TaxID=447962 RepID=A0AAD5U6D4_9FUNG|nr:hypothetical protein HK099_003255 [Clydaea vesicula]KAJ3384040.1 hypothetical protein HDU92_003789 [Lobulomyces angularis]